MLEKAQNPIVAEERPPLGGKGARVSLFKPFEIRAGGWVQPITPQEARILFALLLSRPAGRVVSKDLLIEVLWPDPDAEPEWASKQIDVQVCRLKKKLSDLRNRVHDFDWVIETNWGRGFSLKRSEGEA